MSHEHVEYATIARTGTVSYTGTRPSYSPDGIPVRFEVSTYDQPSEFDWSCLHPETPVIDCRSVDLDVIMDCIRGPITYSTEHIDRYRAAGVHVRCACYWRTTYMEGAYTR